VGSGGNLALKVMVARAEKGGIAMITLTLLAAFACSFRICWLIVTSGEHS